MLNKLLKSKHKTYKGVVIAQIYDETGKEYAGMVEVELTEEKPGEVPPERAVTLAIALAGEMAAANLETNQPPVNATQKLVDFLKATGQQTPKGGQ